MEKWKQTKLSPLPIRTFNASWTTEKALDEPDWEDVPVDIANLTMEEQADLIVKRLSTPPKIPRKRTEDEIMEKLAKVIADEIDMEILQKLKGLCK